MPKITLEAAFKESGLDALGRRFEHVSERMKKMGDVLRGWGHQMPGEKEVRSQFALGVEVEKLGGRVQRARNLYGELLEKIDKTNDPNRRAALQGHADVIDKIGQRAEALMRLKRAEMGGAEADSGGGIMSALTLRRGLRLGLGMVGLPTTVVAAGRAIGEAQEQEKMTVGMATRLSELNQAGKTFTEYAMDMRRSIVDVGAAYAFQGREAIQLADGLSSVAGRMVNLGAVLEGSRGLGVSPQVTGQLVATASRLGGREAMPDDRLIRVVAEGISASGMLPRGSEYIQSVISTMQAYATRMPSVSSDTIASVIKAINMTGIPTLRGSGASQVTEGVTRMMDDMSEAMVAIQTQIVGEGGGYKKARTALGLPATGSLSGPDRFALAMQLKQEGLATPEGLKLARETINYIVTGQSHSTKMLMESMLLRLPMPIVSALDKKGFMEDFLSGKMSTSDFQKRASAMQERAEAVMATPAMGWAHLGRTAAARVVNFFDEGVVKPTGKKAGEIAKIWDKGEVNSLEATALTAALFNQKQDVYAFKNSDEIMRGVAKDTRAFIHHTIDVTVHFLTGEKPGDQVVKPIIEHITRVFKEQLAAAGDAMGRNVVLGGMLQQVNSDKFGPNSR